MKFRVSKEILTEDMPRYLPDFYPDRYEPSRTGRTDPEVIQYLRDYYNKNLPVDVTAWIRVNAADEKLRYACALNSQVCYVRNNLGSIFYPDYEDWFGNPTMVVGTHLVEGVTLPVYSLDVEKFKLSLLMSCNFRHWVVSVRSETELFIKPLSLFNPDQKIIPCNCHGFDPDCVYDSYSQNRETFTIMVTDEYRLYSVMTQVLHALDDSY